MTYFIMTFFIAASMIFGVVLGRSTRHQNIRLVVTTDREGFVFMGLTPQTITLTGFDYTLERVNDTIYALKIHKVGE